MYVRLDDLLSSPPQTANELLALWRVVVAWLLDVSLASARDIAAKTGRPARLLFVWLLASVTDETRRVLKQARTDAWNDCVDRGDAPDVVEAVRRGGPAAMDGVPPAAAPPADGPPTAALGPVGHDCTACVCNAATPPRPLRNDDALDAPARSRLWRRLVGWVADTYRWLTQKARPTCRAVPATGLAVDGEVPAEDG